MRKERNTYIDGWDRLTLRTYELMLGVSDGENARLEMMAIANGKTLDYVLNCPIAEANEMADAFLFIQKPPKVRRTKKTYTINGREYEPIAGPSKITTAQYIDYDQLPNKKDLTSVLACVMIPKGHVYNDGYDFEQAKSDMGDLTVEEAVSLCDFFTRASSLYVLNAIRLAEKALRKAKKDGLDVTGKLKVMKRLKKIHLRLFLRGWTA